MAGRLGHDWHTVNDAVAGQRLIDIAAGRDIEAVIGWTRRRQCWLEAIKVGTIGHVRPVSAVCPPRPG